MRAIGRLLFRLLLGISLVLAALLVALVAVAYTDRFREWLRARLVAAVDPLIPATFTVDAVEGSIFGTLTLRNVVIRYDGVDVVRVDRIAVSPSLQGVLAGKPPGVALALEHPVVQAIQRGDGTWNVVAAFETPMAPAQPTEPSASWLALDVAPVTLRDATVTLRTADAPTDTVRAGNVAGEATVMLRSAGVRASISSFTADLAIVGVPSLQVRAAARYDDTVAPALVTIESAEARSGDSTARLTGRVQDLNAPILDLAAMFNVAAADVRDVAGLALRPSVGGNVRLTGPLNALQVALALDAGAATVSADGHVDLLAEPLRWDARATIAGVEVAHLLEGEFPGGTVAATADASGTGTALPGMRAHATLAAEGLSWRASALGAARLEATLADGAVTFTTDARDGPVPVHATGRVGFEEPLHYQVRAVVRQLDPARLPGGRADLKGSINFDADLDGSGTDLEALAARLNVELRPSTIGPVALHDGHFGASVAQQRLYIEDFRLSAPSTSLTVSGDLGMRANSGGRLAYDLRVADVGPWLRLASESGSGTVTAGGTARGDVAALQVDGTLQVAALAAAGLRLRHGAVAFDLAGVQSGTPSGSASATLQGVEAGLSLERLEVRVGLAAGPPASATIGITARDGAQRAQELAANVTYGGAETAIHLTRADLETPAGPWHLSTPALIVRNAAGVSIDGLRLENGEQFVAVSGRVAPTLALTARAEAVDLGLLNALASRDVSGIGGRLDLNLALTGPMDRPQARGRMELQNGGLHLKRLAVTVTDGTARVGVDEQAVRIEQMSAKAGDGLLSAGGTVRIRDYQPQDVDVWLRLDEWPAIDTARYRATLAADLRCDGTVAAPSVHGRVDVLRASLRPDLAMLSRQSLTRDPTITVVGRSEETVVTAPAEAAEGDTAGPEIYKNLLLDVAVGIARNSWVRHSDAVVELTGNVRADKPRGSDLALVGAVHTVRGWVAFRGRRFTISDGEVRFTGAVPIDPSLDIVASHQFPDYLVEVVAGGTASKPTLTLRSDPALEQADILALILFGRTVPQLGEGERTSLQSQAVDVASSFAAQELGRSISDALGLDHLGIDIRQLDVRGGTVGLGAYVTENTYIAIDQDISGKGGTKATIEYSLTPRLQVQTSTSTAGNSEGGIIWKKRY